MYRYECYHTSTIVILGVGDSLEGDILTGRLILAACFFFFPFFVICQPWLPSIATVVYKTDMGYL